jgi:hypothetical protein
MKYFIGDYNAAVAVNLHRILSSIGFRSVHFYKQHFVDNFLFGGNDFTVSNGMGFHVLDFSFAAKDFVRDGKSVVSGNTYN